MNIATRRDASSRQLIWRQLAREADYHPGSLAKISGISLRQLERYFDHDFHCRPKDWLQQERMKAARELLTNADSVKEVAFTLGFKHPAHFCTAFKHFYGVTPLHYTI